MIASTYDYPSNGSYSETLATLPDGRRVGIDVQYGSVRPLDGHIPTIRPVDAGPWGAGTGCPQLIAHGERCRCPRNVDIMAQQLELVIEARERGKFGRPERARPQVEAEPIAARGYGDCQS